MIPSDLTTLTGTIIGAAIAVHRELGPGLLESTYEACLKHELEQRGLRTERQKALPVRYKGFELDCGYRLDLVVESNIIVELKAVKSVEEIDRAQILSYLKLSGYPLGLLINFNVPVLKQGIKRYINARHDIDPIESTERPEDRWLRENTAGPFRTGPSAPSSVA